MKLILKTICLNLIILNGSYAGERSNCKIAVKKAIKSKYPDSKIVDIIHYEDLHTYPITHTYLGAVKVNHKANVDIYYLSFEAAGNKFEDKDCEASVQFYGNPVIMEM